MRSGEGQKVDVSIETISSMDIEKKKNHARKGLNPTVLGATSIPPAELLRAHQLAIVGVC